MYKFRCARACLAAISCHKKSEKYILRRMSLCENIIEYIEITLTLGEARRARVCEDPRGRLRGDVEVYFGLCTPILKYT